MASPEPHPTRRPWWLLIVALLLAAVGGRLVWDASERPERPARPIPVEVAEIARGTLAAHRDLHGRLEAVTRLELVAAVSGRVARVDAELGDEVAPGQVLVTLDRDEYAQSVQQAEADLAVASARRDEAEVQDTIAQRALTRVQDLAERGAASPAELDDARAQAEARTATAAVASAEVQRARAALAEARVRLGDTVMRATLPEDAGPLLVAERPAVPGDFVAANEPVMTVVALDPLRATVFATAPDLPRLAAGQAVTLTTAAHPDGSFDAEVARLAPVLDPASAQARVELAVPNPDGRLRPGMFVRASIEVERVDDATLVPADAVVRRGDRSVVFVVSDDGTRVSERPVHELLADGERVAVRGEGLVGRVVILGQQLLTDGSAITIPDGATPGAP